MSPSDSAQTPFHPPLTREERERVLEIAAGEEAREAKAALAAAFRILVRMGVVDGLYQGLYGHITLRVPGAPEFFWVNSLARRFNDTTVDDLLLVGRSGEVVDGVQRALNQAAFYIHSEVHKARADVNCVAHTHPRFGCAFAALGVPLSPIDQVGCIFFEEHAIHSDYTGVVAEKSQGEAIVGAIGDKRALILANHGLITAAGTVPEAVIDMYELERTCEIQLLALATGREIRQIPPEAARQVRSIRRNPKRYQHEWRVLVRELDRDTRDYLGSAG